MSPFALHLLRHGEPAIMGRMLGRTDCPATPAGIATTVQQVADLEVEAIITSDLARAHACAEAAGQALGRTVMIDRRWREIDFGAWDGLAAQDIEPGALGRFWDDPDANPPPGGERWSALVARVSAAIAGLAPRPTLIVTHGGAMRAALTALCGFEHRQLWAFELPYAALLSLSVWPGERPTAQIAGLSA
jgi:alpha-ribazole phosphatase